MRAASSPTKIRDCLYLLDSLFQYLLEAQAEFVAELPYCRMREYLCPPERVVWYAHQGEQHLRYAVLFRSPERERMNSSPCLFVRQAIAVPVVQELPVQPFSPPFQRSVVEREFLLRQTEMMYQHTTESLPDIKYATTGVPDRVHRLVYLQRKASAPTRADTASSPPTGATPPHRRQNGAMRG